MGIGRRDLTGSGHVVEDPAHPPPSDDLVLHLSYGYGIRLALRSFLLFEPVPWEGRRRVRSYIFFGCYSRWGWSFPWQAAVVTRATLCELSRCGSQPTDSFGGRSTDISEASSGEEDWLDGIGWALENNEPHHKRLHRWDIWTPKSIRKECWKKTIMIKKNPRQYDRNKIISCSCISEFPVIISRILFMVRCTVMYVYELCIICRTWLHATVHRMMNGIRENPINYLMLLGNLVSAVKKIV